ncbi:MAG: transposase [Cyanobacteria bacterium P01_G01_bin.54]
MSPRKLTAEDKEEILERYRQPQETTSTLADRFSVSSSTISRFLKSRLNEGEYEELIQQKRLSRTPSGAAQVMNEFQKQEQQGVEAAAPSPTDPEMPIVSVTSTASAVDPSSSKVPPTPAPGDVHIDIPVATTDVARDAEPPSAEPIIVPTRRAATSRRRRSSAPPISEPLESPVVAERELNPPTSEVLESPVVAGDASLSADASPSAVPGIDTNGSALRMPRPLKASTREDLVDEGTDEDDEVDVHTLEEMLGEDIDLDDEDEEDWDDEEDDDGDALPLSTGDRASEVQVLPLSDAHFPRTCYLVIDRAAELITHPLQDFRDLGHIPGSEASQRTLPVFDNHRVARRFSKRTQRVIKVPDSELFTKTRSYLQARGITRLLLDGQVYAL